MNEKVIGTVPNLRNTDKMSSEDAQGAMLLLTILEALYDNDVKEITQFEMLEMLGYDPSEIELASKVVTLVLTPQYFAEKEEIWNVLRSKVAVKH